MPKTLSLRKRERRSSFIAITVCMAGAALCIFIYGLFFTESVYTRDGRAVYSRELYFLYTQIDVTVYAAGNERGEEALDAVEAVFWRVHSLMNRFDEGSDIHYINYYGEDDGDDDGAESVKTDGPGAGDGDAADSPSGSGGIYPLTVREETFNLIKLALQYCGQSGGAFDIGLGAVSDLWDIKAPVIVDDAVQSPVLGGLFPFLRPVQPPPEIVMPEQSPPSQAEIAEALAKSGYKKIVLDEENMTVGTPAGLRIDLGSIAKGYAVQMAAEALMELGITDAIINAGGNIYALGEKPPLQGGLLSGEPSGGDPRPWNVGVRNPRDEGDMELLAIVPASDKAVVISGDYERYYDYEGVRYHHIMDPATGSPARASISVAVVADDSTLADYLSTALFVLGPEKGLELLAMYPGAEALIVAPDMSYHMSPGFLAVIN